MSDAYHRTLIECLPRFWPQSTDIEQQYKKPTFDLLGETIVRSSWQMQLSIVQSINRILQRSRTLTASDIAVFVEPIINLGPRTKSSGLKREILTFVQTLCADARYSACFVDSENLRHVLQFNIDEMIHDNRSSEIGEQAKQLKKLHEHFFVKSTRHEEPVPVPNVPERNDLF